mgnify:CR=1 FL=1
MKVYRVNVRKKCPYYYKNKKNPPGRTTKIAIVPKTKKISLKVSIITRSTNHIHTYVHMGIFGASFFTVDLVKVKFRTQDPLHKVDSGSKKGGGGRNMVVSLVNMIKDDTTHREI